ncbi:MAG: hypothetical protein J0I99_10710 [Devosia sp.]|uniref:hypothetical protein n=1 Tax=Devosia sp. TaxID=1871048 RepID=UPI001AD54A48|nr:hypothetical protein [Devosia sp.]MBN9308866.1 hypothetical protein [Devosia sp.]MBN9316201.1 hypothetical protein [Devosia sp.]
MGATVLVIMLAAGLGLIAGGYYSLMGWIVIASLLFLTTVFAMVAATAPFVATLLWLALTLVAFNVGLVLSLVIRTSAKPQPA